MKNLPFALWLIVSTALGAWIGVMWLDNQPPYEYDANDSHIFPDPAPQGSMVRADWAIKKINRICPSQVQRYFTNADTGKLVATTDMTPVSRAVKVGDNRIPRAFQLPPDLPPHVGYFTDVCFQCNALQHVFPLCIKTPVITFHMKDAS